MFKCRYVQKPIPSKLLTSKVTPITSTGGPKYFKKLYTSFMVQYRQPLSKAFQSEISFAMHEKTKMDVTVCFVHFFECWFLPVEVRF